jgi:hypothetical protein
MPRTTLVTGVSRGAGSASRTPTLPTTRQNLGKFLHSLPRDGFVIDDETGHIAPIGPRFA